MDLFFLSQPCWDAVSILAAGGQNSALMVFLVYTLAVFALAAMSNRLLQKKSFLSEYFLGSRSLGMWAFALTFAATSASGGSFTGFPARIYTHGWILALWIASYMVVPICTMGFIGKRLNQLSRISGAITVPDVMRDRFRSPVLGLVAVSLIVFFMSFNLVGQFKAGSNILITLLQDVRIFQEGVEAVASWKRGIPILAAVDAAYLLCLGGFAVAVIFYTTYGGFHAVVWTDVMQGLVMVAGVMIMLPLALSQVGGLKTATEEMSRMTTPRIGLVDVKFRSPTLQEAALSDIWFTLPDEENPEGTPRLFRINTTLVVPAKEPAQAGKDPGVKIEKIKVVELTTPEEIERQLERLKEEKTVARFNAQMEKLKRAQIAWLEAAGGQGGLVATLEQELHSLPENRNALLNSPTVGDLAIDVRLMREFAYGSGTEGVYVTGPGPELPSLSEEQPSEETRLIADGFLPLSIAVSFFFMWAISGTGQPSNMVRLMAFNNSTTLRRSIATVAIYYSLIYFPLVVIFCCARILLPGMDLDSDRIMPLMAVTLTENIGQGWLAGVLVAAPFAAIMSTVDSFLLMISSALVRDIYQRNLSPDASEKTIKRLSYLVTLLVGVGAMLGAINPPQFLQDIIVYTGSGLAASFLAPMVFALYWPRANLIGTVTGMLAGFIAHLSMYVAGIWVNGSFFKPYELLNFDPILIGLFVSFTCVYAVTRLTPAPPDDLVKTYFYRKVK